MVTKWEGIIAVEGEQATGGAMLTPNSVTYEDLPVPLRFTRNGSHEGITVGSTDEVWRSGKEIWGRGTLHTESEDPETLMAVTRLIELAEAGLAGVSIGLANKEVEIRVKSDLMEEVEGTDTDGD